MGFLKRIKQMFSKNIDCSDQLEGKLFYYYSKKNRQVNVGANIIVPEHYSAVFVCRDKVCDVLSSGKFGINGATLPKSFERLKLGKANKKGKFKKKFLADIYYISNTLAQDVDFLSYNNYVNKSRKLGKVKARSQGLFDIEVIDPKKMLKYFLSERPYVDEDLFLDLLGGLVGNYVNKLLEINFDDFYEILVSPKVANQKINAIISVEDYFSSYGFKISNVRFDSLNVSTKLKTRIEEYLNKNKGLDYINISLQSAEPQQNKSEENDEKLKKPTQKICVKCGNKLSETAIFCEKCGTKFNNLN